MSNTSRYRHYSAGVLRASARTVVPASWPVLADRADSSAWLSRNWAEVAEEVTHASPALADRVERVLADESEPGSGRSMTDQEVAQVTLAVVRYIQRFGRSTPFGLFAGVAPVRVGDSAVAKFGEHHDAFARVDSGWLRNVTDEMEASHELLALLDVVFTDAVEEGSGRLTLTGGEPVSIRASAPVRLVRDAARRPLRFAHLAAFIAQTYPRAGDPTRLLRGLLDNGFLITSLKAPSTVLDPLGHLLDQVTSLEVVDPEVRSLVEELVWVRDAVRKHNNGSSTADSDAREEIAARMRTIAGSARSPLSLDLRLDAEVELPDHVAADMTCTAGTMVRLVREPTGTRDWRDYYAAFCERYGVGALVPLRDVLDPETGIGWPRGYPTTLESSTEHVFSERDQILLTLAADATATGRLEVDLDDDLVERLVAAGGEPDNVPPHFDFGARIHATSTEALDAGDYTYTVMPGGTAGKLSSRFADLVPGLTDVLGRVPTTVAGAVPVHLSATPIFANAENLGRAAAYLPDVLHVGEHVEERTATQQADQARSIDESHEICLDDLLLTVSWRRFHLVSKSRRRIVEPMVFHAVVGKQQPAVARFVGEISRALDTAWPGFDWGVAASLPFRPGIRRGRAILSPAKWTLQRTDLPEDQTLWPKALAAWRERWRCPSRVQMQDLDQLLPLDLSVSAHVEVVLRRLRGVDVTAVVLVEAPPAEADGWCEGRNHTVVLPLTREGDPAPAPAVEALPVVENQDAQAPGSADAHWLYVKLYVPDHRMEPLIRNEIPRLISTLGERPWWFVRYPRGPLGKEPDHLRLRIRIEDPSDNTMHVIADWADGLRTAGVMSRYAFDTYHPEAGRYLAIEEAEALFVADTRLTVAMLTQLDDHTIPTLTLTAASMFDIAYTFLGSQHAAATWLRTNVTKTKVDRDALVGAQEFARSGMWEDLPGWSKVATAHGDWRRAVTAYRHAVPTGSAAEVLHSLLHMLHNRALGADRESENACLHLARAISDTWTRFHPETREGTQEGRREALR